MCKSLDEQPTIVRYEVIGAVAYTCRNCRDRNFFGLNKFAHSNPTFRPGQIHQTPVNARRKQSSPTGCKPGNLIKYFPGLIQSVSPSQKLAGRVQTIARISTDADLDNVLSGGPRLLSSSPLIGRLTTYQQSQIIVCRQTGTRAVCFAWRIIQKQAKNRKSCCFENRAEICHVAATALSTYITNSNTGRQPVATHDGDADRLLVAHFHRIGS